MTYSEHELEFTFAKNVRRAEVLGLVKNCNDLLVVIIVLDNNNNEKICIA